MFKGSAPGGAFDLCLQEPSIQEVRCPSDINPRSATDVELTQELGGKCLAADFDVLSTVIVVHSIHEWSETTTFKDAVSRHNCDSFLWTRGRRLLSSIVSTSSTLT